MLVCSNLGCGLPGNGTLLRAAHARLFPPAWRNPDGSVDIFIQSAAPSSYESNWLAAPLGKFIVWLRVCIPGESILQGVDTVPLVEEIK